MAVKLKPAAKIIILLVLAGAGYGVYHFGFKGKGGEVAGNGSGDKGTDGTDGTKGTTGTTARDDGTYKIALSEWPGHMPFVLGNGGLTTQPGSAAAKEGIKLQVVFIEDPVKKNAALQTGEVDFVWQVVDEMPINMGSYQKAGVEARAFLQIDWSRGGDACVAAKEVTTVEDIHGRKSAMMMFSPDHTVFEFMLNNSRLTPDQIKQVRKDTSFSMDDFTFGRVLFTQNKVDVACLWEPDVTLALKGRPGAHRLFSTADATELVADVLLTKKSLIEQKPGDVEKVARVFFAGVEKGMADKKAAAAVIAKQVPRFRDELGIDGTITAFNWVKWTNLADNAKFFGIDGGRPAFDRVYNQADSIWTNYPEAEITSRFTPTGLRDTSVIKKLYEAAEAAGAKPEVAEVDKPEYKPEVAEKGEAIFTKPVTINFATGRSDLDPESMHILNNQVLPQLEMAGAMYVRVEGNSDNVGSKSTNKKLSEKRAQSVMEFLVTKGIARERVSAKGNGDLNPVASNKTEDGRAANRRTDILFISGEQN